MQRFDAVAVESNNADVSDRAFIHIHKCDRASTLRLARAIDSSRTHQMIVQRRLIASLDLGYVGMAMNGNDRSAAIITKALERTF